MKWNKEEWETVDLGKICEINAGKTPSRSVKEYWGKDQPWLSIGDMKTKYISRTKEKISNEGVEKSGIKKVVAGTLLMSYKLSIGKMAFPLNDIYTNEAIAALPIIDNHRADKNFLYYVLGGYNYDILTDKAVMGRTLNKRKLQILKIPLPPLQTQRKIADILDTADALRQKTQAQLDALDELAQSVFLEMFGDVKSSKLLIDISIKITDGTHQSPQFVEEGIPFLLISNIVDNQIVFSTKKYISITEYNSLYKRTPIEIGDLLITTVGSYGNPAIVKTNKKFMFQRHIGYIKPDHDKINYIYLFGALKSSIVRRQIEKKVRGVAQKTLNLKELKTLLIPLPSIDLQNQFATIIENIEAQKASLKASLQESEDLFGCLLQEVFG